MKHPGTLASGRGVSGSAGAPPHPEAADAVGRLFAGLFGLLLGIGLLKWGNPVILDRLVEWPRQWEEWRAFAWPVRVGHVGLVVVTLVGLRIMRERWRPLAPAWVWGSLLAWLGWQFLASTGSLDPELTRVVLMQFTCCAVCFFLGHLALSRVAEPRVFWLCLCLGFLGVLGMACDQHFGGLEATRKMIFESPEATRLGPEHLARIRSNRVFSTLVYPNALAGAVLLLLPLATVQAASVAERWGTKARRSAAAAMLVLGLAVLVWSGSKAGWVLALGLGVFVLFHSGLAARWKTGLALALLVGGFVGFRLVFAEKLREGPKSMSARFDYWTAAWGGVRQAPWLGNGPGSFKKVYARVKRPESEMAQLAHNDYLQQANDSGIPGFLAYLTFTLGSLVSLYRKRSKVRSALAWAVWLGAAGWFAQGVLEFGLYIPATSWLAFALLGWLHAQKPSAAPGEATTLPACARST